MHSNRHVRRRISGKTLAALLAAQLATFAGCSTLGENTARRSSVGLPVATTTAPQDTLNVARRSAVGLPPATSLPAARQDTQRSAVAADADLPPVISVAYETLASGATVETYDESGIASDSAYDLTNALPVPSAAGETQPSCPAGVHRSSCNCCEPMSNHDNSREPYRNAQEYIFDGGDQQPAVVIKEDWTTAGVDPTDTVIYYETLAGSVCVRPTNRVPIYAPRFGAVRQVSGLQLATRAQGTQRVLAPIGVERFDENNLAGTVVQPLAPQGEQQVGLIDAFQENYLAPPMEQILPLYRMDAVNEPLELVDLTRTGLITIQELVDMQQLIQNAQAWIIPESLEVEISNQTALLVKDTKAAQDLFVYELPDKCAMRICKAASHTIANSGDIVSFSIRFDNAGVKPLGNAVIIDSLSPRLNYIEGSQQCSVGVRFSAEPNQVGSMVLRWEIEEPIKPSDGGVISFDCRVR